MRLLNINLKEKYPLEFDATLECYLPSNSKEIDLNRKRKNILILPGGGYEMVSDREAEPVALQFISHDYNAFVLRYAVKPFHYPEQFLEVFAAIDYILKNQEFLSGEDCVSLIGFSAGGHLAASSTTLIFKNNEITTKIFDYKPKIKGLILCYPVITMDKFTHSHSRDNIVGDSSFLEEILSVERNITSDFPPCYIWHTIQDNTVSIKNSLLLANALSANQVLYEMHLFPKGQHGLGLCNEITASKGWEENHIVPENTVWIKEAIHFLNQL